MFHVCIGYVPSMNLCIDMEVNTIRLEGADR